MNTIKMMYKTQENDKKTERNGKLQIASQPLEDHLNTLADIIIERILEERSKNTTV